jgi:arginine utilization protein RocB
MKFEEWEEKNKLSLIQDYRKYLEETVLEDDNFDITETEDYWTWANEEFEITELNNEELEELSNKNFKKVQTDDESE